MGIPSGCGILPLADAEPQHQSVSLFVLNYVNSVVNSQIANISPRLSHDFPGLAGENVEHRQGPLKRLES